MQNAIKVGKNNGQDPANQEASAAVSKISLEFHNFIEDMEDLVKASTSLTGDELDKWKIKMNDLIIAGKKSVEGVQVGLKQRAQKSAAVANTYVHDQPWQAIGIGVTTGLLLGYLLTRRS